MNKLASLLWAFILAAMFFGIWTIPILILMLAVSFFLKHKYPGKFDKYL